MRCGRAPAVCSPPCLYATQLNFYQFHGYKPPVVLVDVPGYGYAKRSKAIKEAWLEKIGGFLRDRPSRVLRLTMLLLDSRHVHMLQAAAVHNHVFVARPCTHRLRVGPSCPGAGSRRPTGS